MMKTLCDVTDYDDSDLPLLGVKADIDGSFENDFLRGHAVNKYNKLVPYKESGVTKDDIEKECARRGLGVGSTKTESIKILERSDKRDVSMFPEHLDLEDLAEDMPALIDTEEHKFSEMPFKEVVAILRQMRDADVDFLDSRTTAALVYVLWEVWKFCWPQGWNSIVATMALNGDLFIQLSPYSAATIAACTREFRSVFS